MISGDTTLVELVVILTAAVQTICFFLYVASSMLLRSRDETFFVLGPLMVGLFSFAWVAIIVWAAVLPR